MELDFMLVIITALTVAWGTWTYISRIYDQKIATYANVISNFDSENNTLRRQLDQAHQSIETLSDNPRLKEMEKQTRELFAQRQEIFSSINKMRNKIENEYANHSLGLYILGELEEISPSNKTIALQREKQSADVFRRIRQGMR